MDKRLARSLVTFFFVLPFTVAVIIPAVLLCLTADIQIGWNLQYPIHLLPSFAGIALIICGMTLATICMRFFVIVGQGTPAPWNPPKKLVVAGPYRYVRNPMLSGGICILLGEAIFFGSGILAAWFVLFFIGNHFYFIYHEEPTLAKRYGAAYERYKKNVPRWIPRLKPYSDE